MVTNMKRFAFVAYAANGDTLFQPAARAIEYGTDRFDALKKLVNGNWTDEDKARLHHLDIFELPD